MAYPFTIRSTRLGRLACAGMLAMLAGCASVADDVTTARTITPVSTTETAALEGATSDVAYAALPAAKPGTENTPDALPTPSATADAVPVSALAGAKAVTGAAAATAALAGNAVSMVEKSGTQIDGLISKYAAFYGIPEALLHRVVKRESRYNPAAYNRGHYGLMQIKYATAKGMGYRGPADGLFDAETNLKYGAKYLRGAWLVADDKNDGAVMLYAAGYYYHAKRKGLLEETGLR